MDREVVPCSSKRCYWLLNSSRNHIDLHQAKIIRVIMELYVPKNSYFQAYIIHHHGPTCFDVREAKEILLLQMPMDHGKELPF